MQSSTGREHISSHLVHGTRSAHMSFLYASLRGALRHGSLGLMELSRKSYLDYVMFQCQVTHAANSAHTLTHEREGAGTKVLW